MYTRIASTLALGLLVGAALPALADEYRDTIGVFEKAGQSGGFFKSAYGYAVFPTIGKGGLMYEATVNGQKFSYTPR